MIDAQIEINRAKIRQFCVKYEIKSLAIFGSVLTDRFTSDSDIDVLVTFKNEREPGFMKLVEMEQELSQIMGRNADIRTPEDLSRYFRSEVESKAVITYEN